MDDETYEIVRAQVVLYSTIAGWCAGRLVRPWYLMAHQLYKSALWMKRKYIHEGLSEEEIARLCNTSQATISRWLRKHNLK